MKQLTCTFLILLLLIPLCVIAEPDLTDPSLILYLSFDEWGSQLGQVPDMSSYENHGTVVGTPSLVDGKFGKAIELNGSTDWIEIPHHESLTVDTAVTVMAWIKTPRFSAGATFQPWQGILAKGNRQRSYSFYTEGGSPLDAVPHPNDNTLHISVTEDVLGSNSQTKLKRNVWQHVAAQVDETNTHRYWINGEDAGVVYQSHVATTPFTGLPGI